MIPAQTDRRQIHHGEPAGNDVVIGEPGEPGRERITHGIRTVDAVDFGGLQHDVGTDLDATQAGRGIGREERITRACRENHDFALTQAAHGMTAVIVLDDATHRNGRHDPARDVAPFQGIAQAQGIHDRGEHAHVVAGDPIQARRLQCGATEQIAATHHKPDLDANADQLTDLQRHAVQDLRVDAEVLVAHERFARQLEQDASVSRCAL